MRWPRRGVAQAKDNYEKAQAATEDATDLLKSSLHA